MRSRRLVAFLVAIALGLGNAATGAAQGKAGGAKLKSEAADLRAKPLPQDEPESLACKEARARGTKLLAELDPKIGAPIRALAAEEGGAAEDWDRAAGIAYLAGGPVVSLWAELNALKRSWQAEYVGDAGIYLVALGGLDDARFFLNCALAMGSRSPFVFEALALAYDAAGDRLFVTGKQWPKVFEIKVK